MATKKKLLQAAAGNASSGYKYLLATSSNAARGLLLYDISDPTSPTLKEHNQTYYTNTEGDYDYVHDRMHIMVGSTAYSFKFNTGSITDVSTGYSTTGYTLCILADGANQRFLAFDGSNLRLYPLDSDGKRTGTAVLDTENQGFTTAAFWADPTNEVFLYGCQAGNRIRQISYANSALSPDIDYTNSLTVSGADNNRGIWVDPTYGYVYSWSLDDRVLYSQGPFPATTGVDTVSTFTFNTSTGYLAGSAYLAIYMAKDFSMLFGFDQSTNPDRIQYIPIDRATGTFGTPGNFSVGDNHGGTYALMNADEERSLLFVGRTAPTDRINIYDYSDLSNISLVGTMDCQTDSGQTLYNITNIALAKE